MKILKILKKEIRRFFRVSFIRMNWKKALAGNTLGLILAHDVQWKFSKRELKNFVKLHKKGLYREKIEEIIYESYLIPYEQFVKEKCLV